MPAEVPSTQFPKEERHDIKETFADSLGQCFFDGQTFRLELCSTRLDEAKPPPAKPTGKRHVVARIVLTPRGAVELLNACNQIAGAFKQAGILKETPATPASGGDGREARPARSEPRPERTDAQPAAGKSPYDSLDAGDDQGRRPPARGRARHLRRIWLSRKVLAQAHQIIEVLPHGRGSLRGDVLVPLEPGGLMMMLRAARLSHRTARGGKGYHAGQFLPGSSLSEGLGFE
jgi:hypothetical protein